MTALLDDLADDLDLAFPRLLAEHQAAVFSIALRCSGRRDVAEEVAQDTFVRAYRSLAGWPRERVLELRPRAWLLRIAVNAVHNRHRDEARRPGAAALDEGRAVADPGRAPEAALLRGERDRRLSSALARLSSEQRLAVVLRHLGGLSYAEIAKTLDRPVGTVKAQVHRGLRRLAEILDPDIMEAVP